MVWLPSEPGFGVYVTEQLLLDWLTGVSIQFGELNIPDLELMKLTKPVGGIGIPGLKSVTFAVQAVGALTGTVPGLQATSVTVMRGVTCRKNLPELPEWSWSPL